jgi:UDP-2,3-diacylglucosamine pyrophosphatase LpxH
MADVQADTILISDLHLGSDLSRAKDARALLKRASFRRLVLLGDIFCDLNFRRLKKEHWEFLSLIRKLSNPKRGIEVIWVEGNHDYGLTDVMSHLVGVRVYDEYAWDYRGRRFLAIHGHQFDRFLVNNALLSRLGELLFLEIQKIDFKGGPISRWLDRLNSRWLRLTTKVAEGAMAHARARSADVVFCGHTHAAMHQERDGVDYYNTGCWTHLHPTYVAVDPEGVHIHEYVRPAETEDQLLEVAG